MSGISTKFIFIRNMLVRCCFVLVISFLLIIFSDVWNGKPVLQSVKIYGVLGIVLLGCAGFIANAMWNSNEGRAQAVKDRDPEKNFSTKKKSDSF